MNLHNWRMRPPAMGGAGIWVFGVCSAGRCWRFNAHPLCKNCVQKFERYGRALTPEDFKFRNFMAGAPR